MWQVLSVGVVKLFFDQRRIEVCVINFVNPASYRRIVDGYRLDIKEKRVLNNKWFRRQTSVKFVQTQLYYI